MIRNVKCESCGGALKLDEDHLISFCPYCGAAVKRDETSMDELRLKLKYQDMKEQREAKEEREQAKSNTRQFWFAMLGMFGLMLFLIIVYLIIR